MNAGLDQQVLDQAKGSGKLLIRVALTVLLALHERSVAADKTWQPSLRADQWNISYSPGMADHPKTYGAGWQFAFPRYEGPLPCPQSNCPSVGYVTTKAGGPLLGHFIEMTVEIEGLANFAYQLESENNCLDLPSARLFIQRKNDRDQDSFRWWSALNSVPLLPGIYTIKVPLTPDRWSNVAGRSGTEAEEDFYHALEEAENIGMTFGGGCFFGHGVNVAAGQASFTLKAFSIMW